MGFFYDLEQNWRTAQVAISVNSMPLNAFLDAWAFSSTRGLNSLFDTRSAKRAKHMASNTTRLQREQTALDAYDVEGYTQKEVVQEMYREKLETAKAAEDAEAAKAAAAAGIAGGGGGLHLRW